MKRKTIELFHIGQDFYSKSNTWMSSIYHKDSKERCDWGKVQILLEDGYKVIIVPATKKEMDWAQKQLTEILNKRSVSA